MPRQSVLVIRSGDLGWSDLIHLVHQLNDFELVGETRDSDEARRLATSNQPKIIMLAQTLGDETSLELATELRLERTQASRIYVCSSRLREDALARFLTLGVFGYLLWSDLGNERLEAALKTISSGAVLFSESVGPTAIRFAQGQRDLLGDAVQLTPREQEIAKHLYLGRTRREIASALGVSPATVKRNIDSLKAKLDAPTQYIVGARAALLGFIP